MTGAMLYSIAHWSPIGDKIKCPELWITEEVAAWATSPMAACVMASSDGHVQDVFLKVRKSCAILN